MRDENYTRKQDPKRTKAAKLETQRRRQARANKYGGAR